ncbi:MAG: MFS transporter [Chloroflexota bacterium]
MGSGILGRQGLPIFANFFLWSVGTGAIQLARPLFAASFGVPVFLVSLITTSNSVARLVSAPITGWAMDRWGRRPVLIIGVFLRGVTALWEFFTESYLEFLVLEFIGGIGVAIWATGANILVGDVSDKANRGMVVATRSFSIKLGTIAGPAIGALLAVMFGLRSIFLFNFVTKIVMLIILFWMMRETRPEPRTQADGKPLAQGRLDPGLFLNKPFVTVAFATIAISSIQQGVFQALFPVFSQDFVGLPPNDIGLMMTLAGVTSLLISFPNGWLVDQYGRKASMVPGLLILGLSCYLLGLSTGYWGVVLMVLVYGIGEGMAAGSSQTYAIDLAPADRRGAFIGVWSLLQNAGSIVAPISIGIMADAFGYGPTFTVVGIIMAVSALLTWVFGKETFSRAARPRPAVTP